MSALDRGGPDALKHGGNVEEKRYGEAAVERFRMFCASIRTLTLLVRDPDALLHVRIQSSTIQDLQSAAVRVNVRAFLPESHSPDALFRNRYVVIHTSGSSGEV